ncbi:transposase [Corynebacterium diphtheriae bv. gravis]|uniref:Transposase n=3 Tax=Corynebacterium diphtheriae TaxID=1717 RepID=A0A811G1T5_CORDP|nr:transposase-like protein [Corynebacterium diphtheriae HC02]AEX77841.1 transposase-like protein [Corynebacterium diphtheriae HC03]KJJ58960.1 transposase [Corynebacterium diphtheriae]KLN42923.1 transposase [Corynebacterium diphtheriae bv. gravis str. ISS 4060]OWM98326.1 transposase [Corynebacterium diphtheriae bv. mitis]OWN09166.1 transposase [Corynebacterium belfantii]OWN27798.1 transposase [Corynebacterium diphtheriae bv. gravis]
MYYGEYFASVDEFYRAVDDYIFWYNNTRFQQRFKGLTPMHYRNQALEGLNHLELTQSGKRGAVQHHIIAASTIKKEKASLPMGMMRSNAPAIQMEKADHKLTQSWGRGTKSKKYQETQAQLVREGRIDEAFQGEYGYIKSMFPGKYDQALDEMIDDALSRGFLSKDFRTADSLAAGNLPIDSHVTALPA